MTASKPGTATKPQSRGMILEVSGSKPGTASAKPGTSAQPPRTGTGAPRTGTSAPKDAFEALTATLIKKMREKFGSIAADIQAQELIAREVSDFMTKTGAVRPEDLSVLEDIIRQRLSGETPATMTRSIMRKKLIEMDDWARIQMLEAQEAQESEAMRQARLHEIKKQIKDELDVQVREKERRRLQELQEDDLYHRADERARVEWEREEEAKRAAKLAMMDRLKEDREAQIDQIKTDRERVIETRKKEEDALLRSAYRDYKAAQEAEAAEKQRQRNTLEGVKVANEENRKLKEIEKKKLIEEELLYNKLFDEELAKQEQKRKDQLEKMKVWQAKTAEQAKSRPPAKRWIDESIIDKYLKEQADKDAKREAMDKARKANMVETFRSTLELQIKEREEAERKRKEDDYSFAAKIAKDVAAAKELELKKKQALAAEKSRLRADLDAQIKEDAIRRRVTLMTETEKQINKELLQKVTNTLRF